MKYITALAVFCLLAGEAFAQDITTHKVTDRIYMLEGNGGNIGACVGEDGVLIIDTQFANMAGPVRDALAKLGGDGINFILNTHFHGDHTGGNAALGQGVPILAHENVYSRMSRGKDLNDTTFRNSLPAVTVPTGGAMTLHFNGETIRLVAFPPAHTDTDSVIYFTDANVAHLGDHFFVGRFPFIDLAGGGSVKGYLQNLDRLLGELADDVKIIPGHGPLATKQDLRDFRQLIQESVDYIQQQIGAGKDEDAIARDGLPDKFDGAGDGFISERRWIGIVHNDLTR